LKVAESIKKNRYGRLENKFRFRAIFVAKEKKYFSCGTTTRNGTAIFLHSEDHEWAQAGGPWGPVIFLRLAPEGSLRPLASAPGGTYGVFFWGPLMGLRAPRARGLVPPSRSATVRPHKCFSYF
jgi:hypothetical protein